MSFRQSAGYRVMLMVLSLACLATAGYFVWQALKPSASLEEVYKQAEASYNQGEEAFKGGNFQQAVEKFDAARKQAEQVLATIEKQREQAKASGKELAKKEELDALDAKAHYVRARAIRDKFFAQSAVDGKAIPDKLDTSTGERYRDLWRIPDPKERDQSAQSLAAAAVFLTKEAEIQREAVRFELDRPGGWDWERLSKVLNVMLELDSKNGRAIYLLSRYDLLQPVRDDKGVWIDSPADKRSQERIERALRGVRQVKELGNQPLWRLIDIEGHALEWLADSAAKKKLSPNKSEDELRILILHPSTGAVAVIRKSEKLDLPTRYDLDGALTAHQLAVKLAASAAAKPGGDRKAIVAALNDFLDSVPKIRDSVAGKALPAEVTRGLLEALSAAQTYPGLAATTDWAQVFDKYLDAAADSKQQNVANAEVRSLLTDILRKEIRRAAERPDGEREKKLRQRQMELIDSALKEAESQKLSRAEINGLHARALEVKLLDGAKPEELAVHLQILAAEPATTRPAIASFTQGFLAWRQGKLLLARDSLEASLRYRDSVDFLFGAQWLLYQIYTATGQTGAALNALRDTESYFAQPDRFSALDRLALADAPINAEDYVAHMAVAHIEVSRQNLLKHLNENPDAIPPVEMYATAEKNADAALKKLRSPSAADLYLRLALFRLQQVEQRKEVADKTIQALRREYAGSLAVLAAQAAWIAVPRVLSTDFQKPSPEGIQEADALIDEYCSVRPRDTAAKLFRLEWLVRTNRTREATDLLKEPSYFDPAISAELLRSMSHLRGYPLFAPAAREIREGRPTSGVETTAVLIQAIADQNREPGTLIDPFRLGETRVRQALRSAARDLADGKFEEAARTFVESAAVASLMKPVRDGLWLTVHSCAAVDPARARRICVTLADEQPDQPSLYFGAAFAALLLRDFGETRDIWERSKSMAAALNRWEQYAKRLGSDPAELAMTRAHFWQAAERPALAREEAGRAMVYDAYNTSAVVFMGFQALEDGKADSLKLAQKYWNTAVAVDPDDVGARCLEAQIKARKGEWTGAARVAQDIVRDHPQSSRAHATLVRIGFEQRDNEKAIAWIRQWIKALPCDAEAAQMLVEVLIRSGKKDEARAAADDFLAGCTSEITRRLDELKPATDGIALENWQRNSRSLSARMQGEAWLAVVSAFRRAEQPELADLLLESALAKNPDAEVLLMVKAERALAAENPAEAASAFRRILAKNPRHEGAAAGFIRLTMHLDPESVFKVIRNFGWVEDREMIDPQLFSLAMLLAIGEVHEQFTALPHRSILRQIMVESLPRFPNDPRIQLYAGQLHYVMGDGVRAADCLQRALRLCNAETVTDIADEERRRITQAAQQSLDRLREEPRVGASDA